jgi:hypothetical protein
LMHPLTLPKQSGYTNDMAFAYGLGYPEAPATVRGENPVG